MGRDLEESRCTKAMPAFMIEEAEVDLNTTHKLQVSQRHPDRSSVVTSCPLASFATRWVEGFPLKCGGSVLSGPSSIAQRPLFPGSWRVQSLRVRLPRLKGPRCGHARDAGAPRALGAPGAGGRCWGLGFVAQPGAAGARCLGHWPW